MFTAVFRALSDILSPSLRRVLLKAVGLALLLVVLIGIGLQRVFAWLAGSGANWAEAHWGAVPHAGWDILVWILSIMASLGIITGALFLMPAVTAFVGSFFVDEIAEHVEREHYPAQPAGTALPFFLGLWQGILTALLAALVYLLALPFVFFGIGLLVMFLVNAWLLSREYFQLAAMRFRTPDEARALRKRHAGYLFLSGMAIALFVSIPVVNLATPLFATAMMVHLHKHLSGRGAELIEPTKT